MKSIIGEINSFISLDVETIHKAEEILKNGTKIFSKAILNKGLEKIGLDESKRNELENLFKNITEFNSSELEEYKNYKKLINDFKATLMTKEENLKIILIDELDRCRPTYAIELLETVKHFFGVKNIIFIFLVNKEQLSSIVSTSYLTEDKCSEYFEKFFDIQFSLPELDYENFLEIEYNKYNQLETYKVEAVDRKYISNDTDRLYEAVF
ncbi:P-loop NTPase fold protein [uncultured Fusobacterium sp.]|uniref:P-loop NTPase fold protein n=1 Tax=uncultured Fusobacterium sp. TaxID=159267 RepID=UPI0027DAB9D5|nr:P-loop NTPase fold protein [uncultured Fusobacterium sp.]